MEHEHPFNSSDALAAEQTYIVNVNEKGRMTLPIGVRQLLHLPAEPSMVQISVQANGHIAIQGRLPSVMETAGAVSPLAEPKSWKEMEAIVRDDVAQHYQPDKKR